MQTTMQTTRNHTTNTTNNTHNTGRRSAIALLTLACTVSINLAQAASPDLMQAYLQGVRGDASQNQQSYQTLTKAQQAAPADLELLAMLGAVETSGAKHAWMPWNKMKAAEQGLAKLDKALRLLPESTGTAPQQQQVAALTMQVHTIAGCTFVHLPEMFNRFEQGYQLLKSQLQNPAFQYAPAAAQQALYSCGSQAANKAGDSSLATQWQSKLGQ